MSSVALSRSFFFTHMGVAGLQAIATAKRLGARVEAFDVRPQAWEQILSLGAKSLKIDLDRDDEIMRGCLVTHQGEIVNEMIREAIG